VAAAGAEVVAVVALQAVVAAAALGLARALSCGSRQARSPNTTPQP